MELTLLVRFSNGLANLHKQTQEQMFNTMIYM